MHVIVVGSGIAGASVAYHAAVAGARVTLVDRDPTGRDTGQATAAGAGIVCPWSSRVTDPDWYRLASAGAGYYPDLVAALAEDGETDLGHRRVGALALGSDEGDLAALHHRTAQRAAAQPLAGTVERVGPETVTELFPPVAPGTEAVHVPGAARVDGRRVRDALRRAATRHGAEVITGVAAPLLDGDRVRGVALTDGTQLAADAVVVAAGAWTPETLAPAGVRIAVSPQRGQIVHLGLPGTDTSAWPVLLPPGGHYLLAFDDARVVVGATREDGTGWDRRVTAAGLAEVLTQALAVAPGLADATHRETRVGFRPMGPDIRPLLGPVPGVAGLTVLTGLGASGLTIGPYAGKVAATLALGGEAGVPLEAYDPLRAA